MIRFENKYNFLYRIQTVSPQHGDQSYSSNSLVYHQLEIKRVCSYFLYLSPVRKFNRQYRQIDKQTNRQTEIRESAKHCAGRKCKKTHYEASKWRRVLRKDALGGLRSFSSGVAQEIWEIWHSAGGASWAHTQGFGNQGTGHGVGGQRRSVLCKWHTVEWVL